MDSADEAWYNRGIVKLYHSLNSVRAYACSTLAGLECLPADLCRPLGAVSICPSALPDPAYYDGLVAKMLACGNPEQMGYIEYRCLQCGQGTHRVAMSCKSSLCLRCAKVYVDNWVSQVSQVLHEGVIYRHIILTVPAMFRTTFYQHAAVVLSAFMRCGAQCLDDFYSTVRGKAFRGGYITVLHTHGRNGQYHPHLHLLATSGGYDGQGARWEHLQYLPYELLRRKWQWHLLTMLRQTLKTDAINQLVDACFTEVSHRLGDQRPKGASPLAVSESGTLCGKICGEPADLRPAHRSL